MKRNRIIHTSIILLVISTISACNLPNQKSSSTPDQVATRVQMLLTKIPTATLRPVFQPTVIVEEPSQTPIVQETSTSAPSPSITQLATKASTEDPRLSLGDPTWKDNLDSGTNFYTYSDDHVKFESKTGYLALGALKPEKWYGWSLSFGKLSDYYLEATFKTEACSGLDQYGLVSRAITQTEGYFLGFSCDGRYSFRKWDGEHFANLVDWTPTPSIQKGANQTNRMGIMAKGTHFSLFANGNLIGEADDNSFSQGTFGFYVSSADTANLTVQADEIAYWKLP